MYKCKITVFTPTYNRGYIIGGLYESLKKQTNMDFEWVVIDDGSTDGTELMFKEYLNEKNDFDITYIRQENGGKHRAINRGVELAKGELFIIVDSDDQLKYNAIETIIKWEATLPNNHKGYAGIAGNRGFPNDSIMGSTFEGDFIDATSLEREKYNIFGDKSEVFYTNILKEFKFPEIPNENFITECVVWYRIANANYKIRWFNEIIIVGDYLSDGLTHQGMKIFAKNPKGYALYVNQEIEYYNRGLKKKMRLWGDYYHNTKPYISFDEVCNNLNISKITLKTAILLWQVWHLRRI